MRLISGSQGRPTDTRRDYEFTDWAQVDRFAHDVLADAPFGTRDAPSRVEVKHEHGT
jgi:hypothetical protein